MQDDNCHLVSPAAVQQDLTVTDPASQAFILIPAASFHSVNINMRTLTTNLLLASPTSPGQSSGTAAGNSEFTTMDYNSTDFNSTSWNSTDGWWNSTDGWWNSTDGWWNSTDDDWWD